MVLIGRLIEAGKIGLGERLEDFKKRMPGEHKTLLDKVAKEAFDDVIPRFHIVSSVPISPQIFTFSGKDYLPLFCSLTEAIRGSRIVFYNSASAPD